MSDTFSWDNGNTEAETPLVKQLRKLLDERDKRLGEQEKALTELTTKVRTQSVADVLREIGAKPGLARFVPQGVETSKEAVTAWLKENEDLFGPVAPKTDESSKDVSQGQAPDAPTTTGTPAASPEQIAAFGRMGHADTNTTTLPDVEQSQISQLDAFAKAANGNFDTYLEFLRGDKTL